MEELVKRVEAKCGWLYGQILAVGEVLMLVGEDIAQLVGQALGVAYPGIDVGVRVSVYPIVNAAVGDIVLQFYSERPVCLAALKLGVKHTKRRHMMGDDNLMGCLRICHCILDKGEATFMLSIELGMGHQLTFI